MNSLYLSASLQNLCNLLYNNKHDLDLKKAIINTKH